MNSMENPFEPIEKLVYISLPSSCNPSFLPVAQKICLAEESSLQ